MVNIVEDRADEDISEYSGNYCDSFKTRVIYNEEKYTGFKLLFSWLIAISGSWGIIALLFWALYHTVVA